MKRIVLIISVSFGLLALSPAGVAVGQTPTPTPDPSALPLDKTMAMVRCTTCHEPHYSGSSTGMLLRMSNINTLCTQCHTLADLANGSHLKATTGVLWPGGQYGSTFPQITDTTQRGYCSNCHRAHGWPDASAPTPLPTPGNTAADYPMLLVESQAMICFTCHDSDGQAASNVYAEFNPTPAFSDTSASGAPIDQKHDPALCAKCHDPHRLTASQKVTDPDNPGQPLTATYSKANTYQGQSYQSATTDLDPLNPEGAASAGGCNPCPPEPDYVYFCLTCHDGTPPAGVSMPVDMINIATAGGSGGYFGKDKHGSINGDIGSQKNKGCKKPPWTTVADYANGDSSACKDPTNPYAALQCTMCHDGHGSNNLYHLKTQISVANIQMTVGSTGGGAYDSGCWGSGACFNDTTYVLPCFENGSSNTVVLCSNTSFPNRTQRDHYWGAWCTFCHSMSNHPSKGEDVSCQSGHMHDGGNW